MVTRTSTRWFRHWSSVRKPRPVPFVTESGKFSSRELITWDSYPEQIVASLTSTVYTRLLKIWRKRKSRFVDVKPKTRKLLLQVAAFYTISHSDYFLDRALAVLDRVKPLAKLVSCFVRKLDDKFWFVYRQVCYQTYWLTFQSLEISDKSSKRSFKDFMSEDIDFFKSKVIKGTFETACDAWRYIKFRTTPYVPVPKIRDRRDPVLAFFEDWSET